MIQPWLTFILLSNNIEFEVLLQQISWIKIFKVPSPQLSRMAKCPSPTNPTSCAGEIWTGEFASLYFGHFLSYNAHQICPHYWILCNSCAHGHHAPLSTGETLLNVEGEIVSQQPFGVILIADNSEATNVSALHTMSGSRTKKYCFCTRPLIVCLAGILQRHVQQSCSIIWLLRVGKSSSHPSPS